MSRPCLSGSLWPAPLRTRRCYILLALASAGPVGAIGLAVIAVASRNEGERAGEEHQTECHLAVIPTVGNHGASSALANRFLSR